MSDKRSVLTDALATLGAIIDGNAGRDAIHVAVEPCKAGCILPPGHDIGIKDGLATDDPGVDWIGIVDPFLKRIVQPGEYFWMLLYPRTITSLRHTWTHPALEDNPLNITPADRDASEAWMRKFCEYHDCGGYEWIMDALHNYDGGEYLLIRGRDVSGEIAQPLEFWKHAEVLMGCKFPNKASWFTCTC